MIIKLNPPIFEAYKCNFQLYIPFFFQFFFKLKFIIDFTLNSLSQLFNHSKLISTGKNRFFHRRLSSFLQQLKLLKIC